jgi:hypothetical protein
VPGTFRPDRIRYLIWSPMSSRSMSRFVAVWVTHAAVGCAVAQRTRTRRVARSMIARTYRRTPISVTVLKKTVSKKSAAMFWMSVVVDLKNRGVADVFFVVCDGLKGLPDTVEAVWPHAIVQTCIIHLIRNTFRLTSRADLDAIKRAIKLGLKRWLQGSVTPTVFPALRLVGFGGRPAVTEGDGEGVEDWLPTHFPIGSG